LDVGVEDAHKLEKAGVGVIWRHYEDLTHGWLQMTAWSKDAENGVRHVAEDLRGFCYEK
jgi:acetyl esterase/lipase